MFDLRMRMAYWALRIAAFLAPKSVRKMEVSKWATTLGGSLEK